MQRIEEILLRGAREFATRPALVTPRATVDYTRLLQLSSGMAERLRAAGLQSGDHVAVFLDKTIEAATALFGIWQAGGVVVPVYEGLRSRQVAHIVTHSESRYLVSNERKLASLDERSYAGVEVVVAQNSAVPWQAPPQPLPGDNAPAVILYTSGSTGLPKGILVSHRNLLAGTRIVAGYLGIRSADRILSVLPFSFDYGLNQLLTAVHTGAALVLQRSHFAPDICRALQAFDITGLAAVPPLWIQLMSSLSPLRTMQLPNLRYITNSGGRFPVELVREYRRCLPGVDIYLMYGLSEAFRSTYLPPEIIDERPDSMGTAMPLTEILVVDAAGSLCAADEPGELVHRGPTVALGYWNDPQTTARVFRADTLPGGDPASTVVYSGDLVRRDKDGFLYFVGRRDGLIKTQGYRVSPEEVEETILASGLVDEIAVCARDDEQSGAAVVAHVVPRDAAVFAAEALLQYCQREMPGYMVPREVHVHASLPRTASGKIDRRALNA